MAAQNLFVVVFFSVPVLFVALVCRVAGTGFFKQQISEYGHEHDEESLYDYYVYDDKRR